MPDYGILREGVVTSIVNGITQDGLLRREFMADAQTYLNLSAEHRQSQILELKVRNAIINGQLSQDAIEGKNNEEVAILIGGLDERRDNLSTDSLQLEQKITLYLALSGAISVQASINAGFTQRSAVAIVSGE